MARTLFYVIILFCIGLATQFLLDIYNLELSFFTLVISIFIVVMTVYISYYFFVMMLTNNVNTVDKYIKYRRKHPYYALLLALVEKDYGQAEAYLVRLGRAYDQVKTSLKSSIQLETCQLDEAKETIAKIKNKNILHHNAAILALTKNDLGEFNMHRELVKPQVLKYSLEAELAYSMNDFERAENFGKLAISNARGIQKWTLVKSLDYQKTNPNRKSFF